MSDGMSSMATKLMTIIQTKVLPEQATVFVWPCSPAAGPLLLHPLLLLHLLPPSSWPRPAGARAETAGNPHRPLPTLSSPTPGHRTPHKPARREESRWLVTRLQSKPNLITVGFFFPFYTGTGQTEHLHTENRNKCRFDVSHPIMTSSSVMN